MEFIDGIKFDTMNITLMQKYKIVNSRVFSLKSEKMGLQGPKEENKDKEQKINTYITRYLQNIVIINVI